MQMKINDGEWKKYLKRTINVRYENKDIIKNNKKTALDNKRWP